MINTIEYMMDGLVSYINTNLPEYLKRLESEYNCSLPMYTDIYRSDFNYNEMTDLFPVLMLRYGQTDVVEVTMSDDRLESTLSLWSFNISHDLVYLQQITERYIYALKKMFDENPTAGDLFEYIKVKGYSTSVVSNKNYQIGFIDLMIQYSDRR